MKSVSKSIYLCRSHRHHWDTMEDAQICCAPGWEPVFELPRWCKGYEWFADVILYRGGMIYGFRRKARTETSKCEVEGTVKASVQLSGGHLV